MNRVTIKVSQANIDQGKRNSAIACPVAKALREVLPLGTYITVGAYWVAINSRAVDLPEHVTNWIFHYDDGENSQPLSFEIALPVTPPEEASL